MIFPEGFAIAKGSSGQTQIIFIIKKSEIDIKNGRIYSLSQIKKELKI
jgi:hypothetical protein